MFATFGYMLGYGLHVAHQAEHLPYKEEDYLGGFQRSRLVLRLQKAFRIDLGLWKVHLRSAIEIITQLSNPILLTFSDDHALPRGFDCLNWLIDEVTVTMLLMFLHSYVWFVLICPALQKLFVFAWAQRNGGFLSMPILTVA